MKRTFYIKEVSAKYDIYESVIYRELERLVSQEKRAQTRGNPVLNSPLDAPPANGSATIAVSKDVSPEERDLLKLLMEAETDVVEYILANVAIPDFSDSRVRDIASLVLSHRNAGTYTGVDGLIDLIEDRVLKDLIVSISFNRYELSHGWDTAEREVHEGDPWQIAKDAILFVKRQAIHTELEENQKRIRQASQQGEDSRPFLLKHQELLQQMKILDAAAAQKG